MEIINIIFLILICVVFSSISFPLGLFKFTNNLGYTDKLIFNIIIQVNIILLLSFFNISLRYILIGYFLYLTVCIFFHFKNFNKIKLINYSSLIYYLFLFIICFLICLDISYSLTLDWDSQKFWIPKTLNFYNNGAIATLANAPQPEYPYLGSLLWATLWKISFIPEEYTGRLIYVFLYCLSLASLTEMLKLSTTYKMIFFIILVLLTYDYIYFSGSQDILVFCLISFGIKTLHDIINNDKISYYEVILLLLICNSLIWTKQEGVVYAFIFAFSLIIFKNKFFYERVFFLCLVILLFSVRIFIYNFYDFAIHINNCCWTDLSPGALIEKLSYERTIVVLKFFIFSFLKNSLFLLGLVFFITSFLSKRSFKKDLYIYFFCMMCFCFIFSAYIFTDEDLVWMLKTGLDRLIFAVSPAYVLIIIRYINMQNLKI